MKVFKNEKKCWCNDVFKVHAQGKLHFAIGLWDDQQCLFYNDLVGIFLK